MKLSTNIQNVIATKFDFVRDMSVYLDIDFPILFSFESSNQKYLGYTLDYNRLKLSAEIVVTPSNDDIILELLSQRKSIQKVLTEYNEHIMLSVNLRKSLLSMKKVKVNNIQNLLPSENYMLDHVLPNRIDLNSAYIELNRKRRDRMSANIISEIINPINTKMNSKEFNKDYHKDFRKVTTTLTEYRTSTQVIHNVIKVDSWESNYIKTLYDKVLGYKGEAYE